MVRNKRHCRFIALLMILIMIVSTEAVSADSVEQGSWNQIAQNAEITKAQPEGTNEVDLIKKQPQSVEISTFWGFLFY